MLRRKALLASLARVAFNLYLMEVRSKSNNRIVTESCTSTVVLALVCLGSSWGVVSPAKIEKCCFIKLYSWDRSCTSEGVVYVRSDYWGVRCCPKALEQHGIVFQSNSITIFISKLNYNMRINFPGASI